MPSLLIRAGTRRKVFQILDPEFTVGRGEGNALRIPDHALGEVHLRFSRVGDRFRVEAVAPGGTVRVNGRDLEGRSWLEHGDRIDAGPVALAFWADGRPRPVLPDVDPAPDLDPEPAVGGLGLRIGTIPSARSTGPQPAARPAATPRVGGRPAAEPRRPVRRRGMPRAAIWWNAILVTAVVGFLLFRHFAAQRSLRQPEDLVTLAVSQRAAGDHDRALATLELARENTGDVALRRRIAEMTAQIRGELRLRADLPQLQQAARGVDQMRRFVALHLADGPPTRAASRELLGMTDAWLDEFRAVCSRHDGERELIAQVEDLARRHRDVAALGEPDRAEDVLFAAGRRARFVPRRFPEAIRILEDWLASAPADAADRSEVEAQVRAYREAGRAWVATERAAIERMVARGEIDRAVVALRDLIDAGALPDWLDDEPARLLELERRAAERRR